MEFDPFIGRETELQRLRDLTQKRSASMVVIKGRRRVGKSRLVQEFARQQAGYRFYQFSGLAPVDGVTDQSQRDAFAYALSQQTQLPELKVRAEA